MPIPPTSRHGFAALAIGCLLSFAPTGFAVERAAVAVVTTTAWSPNDPSHDGAQEFAVLMSAAAVQRGHALSGLVGVADRQGAFQNAEERALRFAALNGVSVVKVAAGGRVVHCPDEIFVEAGNLAPAEACQLLAQALERCGPAPRAGNPLSPTDAELQAIAQHAQRVREHIALHRRSLVTAN